MRSVQHSAYGAANVVLKDEPNTPRPSPGPGEVLVEVKATSVNPIDCAVRSGYGAAYWEKVGLVKTPHIPGRDVAGDVVAVGPQVTKFKVGDRVWAGVLSGGAAEFAAIPAEYVSAMPLSLSYLEAASLPYVALTAWSALAKRAGLAETNTKGKRVIIPRGAGGVGSFAIQLMKAWGAHVATICSTRNIELVKSLGANFVVDYKKEDFAKILKNYDVVLDTMFDAEEALLATLKPQGIRAYVSIVSPKLRLIDELGLEEGLKAGADLLERKKIELLRSGLLYDWSFMEPDGAALDYIAKLVDQGLIRPVIDRVYSLGEMGAAHEYCESGAAQGKIVVNVANVTEDDGRAAPLREVA